MIFDVKEIKVIDLNGDVQPVEVGKALGNAIYSYGRSLEWLDISKKIHQSQVVELTESELIAIEQLISQNYVPLLLMVKEAIINHITNLLITK